MENYLIQADLWPPKFAGVRVSLPLRSPSHVGRALKVLHATHGIYKPAKVNLIASIIRGAFVLRGRRFSRYKGQSAAMEVGGRVALEYLKTEFNTVAKIDKTFRTLANMRPFHFPEIICLSAC
jgi:hypothetical protein